MGKRMQGRKGQDALRRRRAAHPMCAHCEKRGIVRATAEIDHIQPLAFGGEDVDSNVQGLCQPCHAIKTAMEQPAAGGASNHPGWLRPARGFLTIVTGPPCAGKSTLVEREAGPLDMVIDLDAIADRIRPGFLHHRKMDRDLMNHAIRARNALLGSLSQMAPRAAAWFIVSAPTDAERRWWKDKLQPVDMIHVDPGQYACEVRASATGQRHRMEAVAAWYERARQPWTPDREARGKVAFGEDGYPVEVGK